MKSAVAAPAAPVDETPSPKGVDLRPSDRLDPVAPDALPDVAAKAWRANGVVKTSLNWASTLGYYPVFRLAGYIADPYYNSMVDRLSKSVGHGDSIFGRAALGYSRLVSQFPFASREVNEFAAARFVNAAEFVMFGTLGLVHQHLAKRDMVDTLSLAVAAELGLPDEKGITLKDLGQSRNLIVASELKRYRLQTAIREGGGGLFLFGLRPGIVGNALMTTAERTVLYVPNALDMLKEAVNSTQVNNLRDRLTIDTLTNKLIAVLQKTRIDSHQPLISAANIDDLRPTLEKIAVDVASKRIGLKGMIHVMAGGIIVVGDPARTATNYEYVRKYGVSGVAAEQAVRNGNRKSWVRQVGGGPDEGIAASARDEPLIEQHRDRMSRGRVHSGIPVDTGRIGGVSLGVGAQL